MDNPEWLVEGIIPTEELHLIGGPSGAGKTTWVIQWLEQWHEGKVESFFGHKVNPLPFCYASVERSDAGVQRKLKRLGINPKTFPWIAGSTSLDGVITEAKKKYPNAAVLFIDGFACFAPGPKPGKTEYKVISDFLIGCSKKCRDQHLTIFGIVHSPKMKAAEVYHNPRQRVLGSVAWAAMSDCIMLVEPKLTENEQITPLRNFFLLPREAPEEVYEMTFETGRLELIREDTLHAVMDAWLKDLDDWEFSTSDAIDFGTGRGYSDRSVRRWLKSRVPEWIEKLEHGKYRKRPTQ